MDGFDSWDGIRRPSTTQTSAMDTMDTMDMGMGLRLGVETWERGNMEKTFGPGLEPKTGVRLDP